jgi:hypothetical protein
MEELLKKLLNDELKTGELEELTRACLAAMYRKLRQEEYFSTNLYCFSKNLSGDHDWVELVFVDDDYHAKYI